MVDDDQQPIVRSHFSHMEVPEALARRKVGNHKPDEGSLRNFLIFGQGLKTFRQVWPHGAVCR